MSPRPKRDLKAHTIWLPPAVIDRCKALTEIIGPIREARGEPRPYVADIVRMALLRGLVVLEREFAPSGVGAGDMGSRASSAPTLDNAPSAESKPRGTGPVMTDEALAGAVGGWERAVELGDDLSARQLAQAVATEVVRGHAPQWTTDTRLRFQAWCAAHSIVGKRGWGRPRKPRPSTPTVAMLARYSARELWNVWRQCRDDTGVGAEQAADNARELLLRLQAGENPGWTPDDERSFLAWCRRTDTLR